MKLQEQNIGKQAFLSETKESVLFDIHKVIHELKHYLPAQAPLKDFIHHNTLHAFQKYKFNEGIRNASTILGYKVSLSLEEYRNLYATKKIREDVLLKVISEKKGVNDSGEWLKKAISGKYSGSGEPRIGSLRSNWKNQYQIDIDSHVHPLLFRIVCSYLDQGISIWNFPVWENGFLPSIIEMEKNSFTSFFKTESARVLLKNGSTVEELLHILVGDEALYEHYLFDQQFAHQGWSGMVSAVEDLPQTLLDSRKITLQDFIVLELLLEIDTLGFLFGSEWLPLASRLQNRPVDLFGTVTLTEQDELLSIWQEAYEWSYYDEVLSGIKTDIPASKNISSKSFQAVFCIDDRETSLRDYLEKFDHKCETFATPGFFGVEFFFQPEHGKFYTKQCPAPVTPKFLIKEIGVRGKRKKDAHFTKHTHSLFSGWVISLTLGFWSACKLFLNIFRPSVTPAMASSFNHMDKYSKLTIENNSEELENNLQIGYTVDEMAQRVEGVLRSIGLIKDFAGLVYVVGHGSSSVNNPHYAAYDCGACSGRPGSVNARVFSFMANHSKVRAILSSKGIVIPEETQFVGGLHDTCRDEISFYDDWSLSIDNKKNHEKNVKTFSVSLDFNAKERSRRFDSIDTKQNAEDVHEEIRSRSVSLFEPRPELNHATNSMCIVGSRDLSKHLFLDRRAFMNSYDYKIDPEGKFLLNILNAVAPVCGGINLEYYFSRVDNQKLGAGTKLPHNVMGLFGVSNGIDGDLRPGLPSQMIEVHDPIRLLVIVEHYPEVVLETIKKSAATYEWFVNEWIHLVVVSPVTKELLYFKDGKFSDYHPLKSKPNFVHDTTDLIESNNENIPVHIIS